MVVHRTHAGPPVAQTVRVAVGAEPPGGDTVPVVAACVRLAADALADAGYAVTEACPERDEEATLPWSAIVHADFEGTIEFLVTMMGEGSARYIELMSADLSAASQRLAEGFSPRRPPLSALLQRGEGIGRAWSQFHAEYPLLLSPCWTEMPREPNWDIASPSNALATMALFRPALPANALGLPAACVPAGRDPSSGVPIGVLLTGARLHEDLCLDAAEAIEERLALSTPIDPAR